MINSISFLDSSFFLVSLIGLILLVKGWKRRLQSSTKYLLVGLFLFKIAYGLCLFLEWANITSAFDVMEDFIGALIPMWWAFIFYAFIQEVSNADIRNSEEKLRRITDHLVGSFVYRHDTEGNLEYVSNSINDVLGYSKNDFLTHFAEYFTDSPVNTNVREYTALTLQGIHQKPYEIEIFHKNGDIRWLEIAEVPVWNESNHVIAVEGIAHDITDRKLTLMELKSLNQQLQASEQQLRAANQQIRSNEERYRSIIEDQTELLCRCLPDGTITFVNDAYCQYFGKSKDQLVGQKFLPLIPKEDRAAVEEYFASFNTENPVSTLEHRVIKEDGQIRWQRWTNRAFFDKNSNVVEFQGTGSDITEHKQAQNELKAERDFSNTLIDSSPAFFVTIDNQGKTRMMNKAMLNALDYTLDEAVGTEYISTFVPPEDRDVLSKVFQQIVEKGESTVNENHVRRKDGKKILIQWHGKAIYDRDGNFDYFFGVGIDITKRKHAEREREKLLKTLENKNEELQSIVYVSSHDLRSPLVNIQGFSGELSHDCNVLMQTVKKQNLDSKDKQLIETLLDSDIPEALEFIKASTGKMNSLLNGLLQVSRVGTTDINLTNVDMNQLLENVTKSMQHQINEAEAVIVFNNLSSCYSDYNYTHQVFTNLIGNALKYRHPDRTPEIEITAESGTKNITYSVTDNGIGIASEYKNKVFEIFHQLNPGENVSGQGLGLTIVKRILDRLDGSIELESELGKGCTFRVTLPISSS